MASGDPLLRGDGVMEWRDEQNRCLHDFIADTMVVKA